MHLQEAPSASSSRRRPSRKELNDDEMQAILRQVRIVVKTMLRGRTIEQSAGLVDVSTSTLVRILRGENLMVGTLAKIVGRLGGQLVIKVERQWPSRPHN